MKSNSNGLERFNKRAWSLQSTDKVSVSGVVETSGADGTATSKHRGWSALNISVEPLFFSLVFIMTFSSGVLLNLLERNVCVQEFNLTVTQCGSRSFSNASMKAHLEATAAQVSLAIQLIQGLCPVALSLFVGPWSDQNGRKPFIMLPFAGYFLYYLLWAALSMYPSLPIKYLLIPSVPLSLTGSVVSVMVCCYCYLCDIFDAENRTFRFNIAASAFLGGGLLANFTVPRLLATAGEYGYLAVFLTCSAVAALSFLYSWLCLQETIEKVQGKGFLFSFENARGVVSAIFMRPLSELTIILLTVAILVSEVILKSGEGSIEYLVGKSQFSWSLNDFTLFSSCNTVIAVLSSVVGSLVMKRLFGFENATIILISGTMLTASEVLRGFSADQRMYWVSTGLSKTGALVGPTIAAEMSNVVSGDDLGKVYAFNALIESGSAYLSSPMYMTLYQHTLLQGDILHVYFLSAGISTLIILSAIFLFVNNRNYKKGSYFVNTF